MYRPSNVNQNTLTDLACCISKKGQYRQPVIIGNMHKILFFQKLHRFQTTPSAKHVIYTVRCKLAEITADRNFIQIFQIRSFRCIFQAVQIFFQTVCDHFPCNRHQRIR